MLKKTVLYIIAVFFHPFLRVKKGKVLFWSYYGRQYSCNPKYISDYLISNECSHFKVNWMFTYNFKQPILNKSINVLEYPSFKSMLAINTAEFVITNCRTMPRTYCWVKKKNQKYIMTWHGGRPLKMVETDALNSLSPKYSKALLEDSKHCDLFLSESKYTTEIFKRAFKFDGEILEKGIPRNDIFFQKEKHSSIKEKVLDYFGISNTDNLVLYAPTFRGDYNIDVYKIDWDRIIPALQNLVGGDVKVLLRLHPNFLGNNTEFSSLFDEKTIFNATSYNDINDLIIASDVMINDYSSCMFDFAFFARPCFLFATDIEKYDRGFYLKLQDLPFPLATNNNELLNNIQSLNIDDYKRSLQKFMQNVFGGFDDGHATESVVNWMKEHSMR